MTSFIAAAIHILFNYHDMLPHTMTHFYRWSVVLGTLLPFVTFFSLQLMQFSSRAYSIVLNTVQADGIFCSANFYSHFSPNGPSTATVCSLHPIFTGFIMSLAIHNWKSVTFVPCNCGIFLFCIFLALKLSRGGHRFSISLLQQLTMHLQYLLIL